MISAKMKEYIVETKTNKVLRGKDKISYNKKIIMTFKKSNTNNIEGIIHNCPICEHEIIQKHFGKCKYCNNFIAPINYNWILTKCETL